MFISGSLFIFGRSPQQEHAFLSQFHACDVGTSVDITALCNSKEDRRSSLLLNKNVLIVIFVLLPFPQGKAWYAFASSVS